VVTPVPGKRRRQVYSAQYIGANGQTVGNCTAAFKFTFGNNQLTSGGSPVAVAGNVDYAPLAPTSLLGPNITTAFSINANLLVWYNTQFYNGGFATFCITGSNLVEAVLHVGPPSGCTPINIGVVLGRHF